MCERVTICQLRVYERGTFPAKSGTYKRIRRWSSWRRLLKKEKMVSIAPGLGVHLDVTIPIYCLDYQCQASSREKAKNLPVFCKWYKESRSCFRCQKKYQYHLTEIFHRNFRTNGKRSLSNLQITSYLASYLITIIFCNRTHHVTLNFNH